MNKQEAGRLGGRALTAKVSNSYFEFIGRRGGRVHVYRSNMASAAEWREKGDTEMTEHFQEKAERYHDQLGNRVMLGLWTPDNCQPRKRKPGQTDMARLRRWEKLQKAA